jgi:hypothetical protein
MESEGMLQHRPQVWVESGQVQFTFGGNSPPAMPFADITQLAVNWLPFAVMLFLTTALAMYVVFVVWLKLGRKFWNAVEAAWILLGATSIGSAVQQNAAWSRDIQKEFLSTVASAEMLAAFKEIPLDERRCRLGIEGVEPPWAETMPKLCKLLSDISRDPNFTGKRMTWMQFNDRFGDDFREQIVECSRLKEKCIAKGALKDYAFLLDAPLELKRLDDTKLEVFSKQFLLIWPGLLAFAFGIRLGRAIAAFYRLT